MSPSPGGRGLGGGKIIKNCMALRITCQVVSVTRQRDDAIVFGLGYHALQGLTHMQDRFWCGKENSGISKHEIRVPRFPCDAISSIVGIHIRIPTVNWETRHASKRAQNALWHKQWIFAPYPSG